MSIASDIIPYLEHIPPLDELPHEALANCARDIRVQYHVKGEHLGQYKSYSGMQAVSDGELNYPLMIVRTGAVSLHKLNKERLELRSEGELFGHPIHFNLGVGEYQCQASEDCLIWHIPQQRIKQLCDDYPAFKSWLLSASGERLLSQSKQHVRYIKDLPLRAPVTAQPSDSVVQCAQTMSEHRVSSLPILSENKLIGILTDKDIRKRFVAKQLSFDCTAQNIMTENPVTTHLDESVEDALITLLRHGIHHLPIVENQEQSAKLCGMVTSGDLMRTHTPHPLRLVRDIGRAQTAQEVIELAHNGPSLLAKLAQELKDVTQVGSAFDL